MGQYYRCSFNLYFNHDISRNVSFSDSVNPIQDMRDRANTSFFPLT